MVTKYITKVVSKFITITKGLDLIMKNLKEKFKSSKNGITLISLVITIIVLLILAGVSIATLTGNNGILTRAQDAKNETGQAQKEEQNILNSYEDKINEYTGIDWDTALANAQKHPDQKTSTAIGVGTDGRAVNMDLWECTKLEDGTYALNDAVTLEGTGTKTAGYIGDIINGKIEGTIPQYIKDESDGSFVEVRSLRSTFYGGSDLTVSPVIPNTVNILYETFQNTGLKKMPEIPNGVTVMRSTFYGCTNLSELKDIPDTVTDISYCFSGCTSLTNINIELGKNVTEMQATFANCFNLVNISKLPDNVINLISTFSRCSNLKVPPAIPNNVINMQSTFMYCTNLLDAPNIPNKVENMKWTFQYCENLGNVSIVIPASVKNMQWTFQHCTKISGQITINAELTGNIIDGKPDYEGCIANCATNGDGLKITGTSDILPTLKEYYSYNSKLSFNI